MSTELLLNDETIGSIVELANKGYAAEGKLAFKPLPNDPDNKYLIVKPDGSFEEKTPERAPRSITLHSVDQVPLIVSQAMRKWGGDPIVYYAKNQVRVNLSESNLRTSNYGSATVALIESPQLKALRKYDSNRENAWIDHKAFMLVLRTTFGDCISTETMERLERSLSSIQYSNASRVSSGVMRNRESLGSEVLSELKSLSDVDIPETIEMNVRMFTDPALLARRMIRCKIETDPSLGKLSLLPLANEIDYAMDEEMQNLGDLLLASVNALPVGLPDPDGTPATRTDEPIVPVFYATV